MVRLWIVLGVAAAVFYIYSVADCALFDRSRVRGLPKPVWLLIIILFPIIGGILWFLVGRGRRARAESARRVSAPDDDPEFLGKLRIDHDQEERIKRLEKELAELDDNGPDDQTGRRDG
ncbi:MAG: PLDc N-terminal domain-containing protein [Actinobacteria bacterium]|jgi:Phospholipase_D-nuclease N-terminal|nr:PLDc N-terminal domain-containing protein [Actinomycetota bacterium]